MSCDGDGTAIQRRRKSITASAFVVALVVALGGALASGPSARAATTTVGCDVDALILAINTANTSGQPETISLEPTCVYELSEPYANIPEQGPIGLPAITGDVTIEGHGATIQRHDSAETQAFRLLLVAADASLSVHDVTLKNGSIPGQGGGAIANLGTLDAVNSRMLDNDGGVFGGAILNLGNATLIDSSFQSNSAFFGSAITNAGDGQLTIQGSVIALNSTALGGTGTIYNGQGDLTLVNSTITQNTAPLGAGVLNIDALSVYNATIAGNQGNGIESQGASSSVNLWNTIISDNSGPNCAATNSAPAIQDGGHNLSSDDSCGFDPLLGSMNGTDTQLQPLADNGGPTQTMLPAATSPAVDHGDDTICGGTPVDGLDQRGVTRPQGLHCDIGAVELSDSFRPLYNPSAPVRRGLWAWIKVQVLDPSGETNISSRQLAIHAHELLSSSQTWSETIGNGNLERDFTFSSSVGRDGGYQLLINTRTLTPGTYTLYFTIDDDPTLQTIQFTVG